MLNLLLNTVSIYRTSTIPSNIVNTNLCNFGPFSPPSRWRISFAIAREPSTIPPPFSSSTFAPKLRNYVIKLHPQRVGGAEIELIAANLQNGLAEKLERTHTRSRIPWFHGISICIGEREHRDSIAVFF